MQELYTQSQTQAAGRSHEVSKVLRNTYTLLAMTLTFSAITAGAAMAMNLGYGASLIMMLAAIGIIWFVLPRTQDSAAGIWVVFAFTGLMGASLGPILNAYIASYANGGALIMQALGGTALVFFGLSGYVLTTGKDFSFMRGFLVTGLIALLVVGLGSIVLSMFGVNMTVVQLAFSAAAIFLFSGFILYDTSRIIHGGETNYIRATVSMYLSIYNIFINLLRLLSYFSGNR